MTYRMHPVDWNDPEHPLAQSEPRRGQRAVLAATVHTPQGPLLCYCLHMEVQRFTLFVSCVIVILPGHYMCTSQSTLLLAICYSSSPEQYQQHQ